MATGFTLEIVRWDEDLIEVRVHAGNGRFAATAVCHESRDAFSALAAALHGFPDSSADRREVLVGALDPRDAGGGAQLVLRCGDRAGHVVADVVVRADVRSRGDRPETAAFSFPVEPAAIDEFVADLGRMPLTVGAAVSLRQAT